MSTAKSPPHVLREEARRIAEELKGVPGPHAKDEIKFGVVMDDKIIKFTMAWSEIDRLSLMELRSVIFEQMSKEPA